MSKWPAPFEERIKQQFSDKSTEFLDALDQPSATSIRINPSKSSKINFPKVPWSSNGYFLPQRPIFTLDPYFWASHYYVQEASSMFLEHVIEQLKSKDFPFHSVLDLCAAPGGKSTLISSLIEITDFLVCNEVVEKRNAVLKQNISKWGKTNIVVTQNNAADFGKMNHFFDLITVDAPCSGEGLFRKDPNAATEWSIENAEKCAIRQFDILNDIWPALKPGGVLIYSTCTYNPEENEHLLLKLGKNGLSFDTFHIDLEEAWGITEVRAENLNGYGFYPHKLKGEGFFCAILQKREEASNYEYKPCYFNTKTKYIQNFLSKNYLEHISEYVMPQSIYAVSHSVLKILPILKKHLYIKQIGIPIGQEATNGFTPNYYLSTIEGIDESKIDMVLVDKFQALQYLSKEIFDLKLEKKGYYFLKYQDAIFGIIKHIGNRHNNLLPPNLRIMMEWKSIFENQNFEIYNNELRR